jgi:hypothetical protein
MTKGADGPDPAPAVANAEKTRVYPLWEEEKTLKPMVFPNASGKRVNMMYPLDSTYWDKLKAFVDYEPYAAIAPETRGVLAAIGIIKGKPFAPTARQKKQLEKAMLMAPKMILAERVGGRSDKRHLYYEDRQYERVWAAATAEYMQESYLDVNQRAEFFQYAYSSAPAMVIRTIDQGAKYPATFRDADGNVTNGSHHYRLHLPAGIPAKLFWAVSIYNPNDGTFPETPQMLPSINGYNKTVKNEDGSIDLFFGPTLPEGAPDSNWIQTVEGRNFLTAVRIYGTAIEFFDQTWKPDDIVKLK